MQKVRDFGTLSPKWHIFIKTFPLQSSERYTEEDA